MKKTLIKNLILLICLTFCGNVFAEVEEEVIVVTNVDYTASLTKKSSVDSATIDVETGAHTGLSSIFTLETNGGDEHFDYIISSHIDAEGGSVSGFGNGGRILFAHVANPPTSGAVSNAKTGSGQSKNVFAYPTNIALQGGRTATFEADYSEYGDCYVVLDNGAETGDITFNITGTPCANTYEAGLDQAGSYKSVMVFTITSK